MSDASLSLAKLLPSRNPVDPAALKLATERPLPPGVLGFVHSKVEEAIDGALQADVLGLIALAWTKVSALRVAADESREKNEPRHLYLGSHEVVSENKIDVRVELGHIPGAARELLPPLTDALSLKLKAKFDGVGLTIENGAIVAIDAGEGTVTAELCYSDKTLLGTTSDPVSLPRTYRLPHPVMIGPATDTARSVGTNKEVAA